MKRSTPLSEETDKRLDALFTPADRNTARALLRNVSRAVEAAQGD
jgi:hypothetical protein